jgi:hypothetical protein
LPFSADNNEVEIVRSGGLDPIVAGSAVAADGLMMNDMKTDKEVQLLEELGTQCARALRNLSVNRTYTAVCDIDVVILMWFLLCVVLCSQQQERDRAAGRLTQPAGAYELPQRAHLPAGKQAPSHAVVLLPIPAIYGLRLLRNH